jgi:general secretion pathway protein G
MANLEFAIRNYRKVRGQFPGTLEALTVGTANDPEPFLSAVPKDPWGQPYEYRIDGDRSTLRSFGEDGQPDTDDDLRWPRS